MKKVFIFFCMAFGNFALMLYNTNAQRLIRNNGNNSKTE